MRLGEFFLILTRLDRQLKVCSAPPPLDSKPEASKLSTQRYPMSEDVGFFNPPTSYPEAPKDMYYEIPKVQPAAHKLARLFPWEDYATKPARVFPDEISEVEYTPSVPSLSKPQHEEKHEEDIPSVKRVTRPADLWKTYTRSNAWDEVPEIEKYMRSFQKPRKASIQVLGGATASIQKFEQGSSTRVTDFPSEVERPSLPVTPAPIRRPNFWAGERDESGELPAAEGVPKQEDWVRLTVDAFVKSLHVAYLYWKLTESDGTSRGAPTTTVHVSSS